MHMCLPSCSFVSFAVNPCSVLLLLLITSVVAAQAPEPPGRWQLETLTLQDGTVYRGLVLAQHTDEIEFAEILQPPGKSMYAVVRGVPRVAAARLEVLGDGEHAQLEARFASFRHRAVVEAGRMEQVALREAAGGAAAELLYEGPSFRLLSTAGDEATRRCVVRIEQMFRSYRTLLPPRVSEAPRLTIALYGSFDEYRSRLRGLDLALENAAFYSARERTIFAGSDLNVFIERLQQTRRSHDQVRQTYDRLDTEHSQSLARLRSQLKAAGFSDAEATDEIRQRRATFQFEMNQALAANSQQQRANEQKFAEVTEQMFRRLAHEALHAWLDTHVYPHGQCDVPRWLNEGLAQAFEVAQYDGDSLRIDAPDRQRLGRLQAELRARPLPLADLLLAEEREFLGPHGQTDTQRHYLYAWGLAWHLAFQEHLLASPRLDEYVARSSVDLDPIARFERLTGQSLAQFERRWRAAMLAAQ
jgi:hypothetical protein